MNVSGTGLSGSATFTADQSGNSTFTVASNATSANTVSTIVARDASGNFSAGTITATLSGAATTAGTVTTASQPNITSAANLATVGTITSGTWSGSFGAVSGANLTSLNASNLSSGTVPGDRGVTAGSATASFVEYNGTTATAGQFDGGSTTPTGTTRLNYGGYFYPTFINLLGSSDTATAATHYFVETGSDGFVRPKTLANTQSEIVTSAVLGSGTANSSTYLRGDRTWATVPSSNITALGLYENNATISANYTIASGNNAISAGPITINSGVTVTVPSGSTWTVT
jgi:hypothetical protein